MKQFLVMALFVVALFATTANAQRVTQQTKAQVSGQIIDTTTNQPIAGATIVVKGTPMGDISDIEGRFSINNLTVGQATTLEITYIGYKPLSIDITPKSATHIIEGKIFMKVDELKIRNVVVEGSAPTAVINGDTTKFNASAYKTNPDATVSDLLEKMPGFEKNDDGSVSSMGEQVQRIRVDGKEFFKNDVATALNALDADMIEAIEMYDDTSDRSKFTGFDDGTEIKTLNIVTKRRLGNEPAYLLDVVAGGGFDNVYQGNVTYTRIDGDKQLSVMGGSNNINVNPIQQRRGFGRGQAGGINTQTAGAVQYGNKLKNDGEISVSYNFQRKETDKQSTTLRTYFPSAEYTDYIYNIADSALNITNTHRFSLDLKTYIGDKTQITFRPTGSLSYGDNSSYSYDVSTRDGDETINDRSTLADNSSYALSGNLDILSKITDRNFFSVSFNGNINNSVNDTYIVGETYYDTSSLVDTVFQNQHNDVLNTNNTIGAGAEFTQKIGELAGISLNYDFEYNWSDNDRKTYIIDPITGEFMDELDPELSNHFLRDYYTNTVSTRFNYNGEALKLNANVGYRVADLENETLYPIDSDYNESYTFQGATINARLKYQKSKTGGSLNISYRGTPTYPSVTQLQDVMNTDNPLMLSSGNPNLDQGFQNAFRLRYRGANTSKSTFFALSADFNLTLNGVVNSTTLFDEDTVIEVGGLDYIAKAGTQYTTYTNMDSQWSTTFRAAYSMPVNFLKSKVNLMGMYRFNNQPSMYNGEKYVTKSDTYSLRVGINSNISENIDFNINNSSSYELSSSNMVADNKYFVNNLRFNLYINVWNNLFISSDYTLRYQHLENTPLDEPFTNLLSASIGKKFGKNNCYEIRANVYDILNQNKSISQQVSDIYVAETLSNDLTRYFAFTFTYKFNSIRNAMDKFRRGDGDYGGPGSGGSGGRGGGGYGGGGGGGFR